jgi:hypothetical protein
MRIGRFVGDFEGLLEGILDDSSAFSIVEARSSLIT